MNYMSLEMTTKRYSSHYFSSLFHVLRNPSILVPWIRKSLFWFVFDTDPLSDADTEHDAWNFWRVNKDVIQTILYVGVFYLAFTIIFAEGYQIPSGSMEPTFHGDPNPAKGDRVFAWKGISAWDEFKRGDIIIFVSAEDQSTFIVKRLIGLPGDKVQIKQGKVFINDEQLKGDVFDELTYYLPIFYYDENDELVYSRTSAVPPINSMKTIYTPKDLYSNLNSRDPKKREESLKKIHQYQIGPFQCFGQNPMIVPKDCYFVLGDNSLHSNDSRYWGWVPKRNVLGKATMIWFPPNRCRLL